MCEYTGDSETCNANHTHPYKLDPTKSLSNLKNVKDDTKGYSVNTYTGTKDGYFVLYPAEDTTGGRKTLCDCFNMIQDIGEDFLNSFSNSFFLNGEYFENILITFGGEYFLLEFIFTKC